MHIKEISIDGFKSYAKRVVVDQFDRSFNAITGLNGSGKSNILDAMCFVLGIKSLETVRSLITRPGIVLRGSHAPSCAPSISTSTHKPCTSATGESEQLGRSGVQAGAGWHQQSNSVSHLQQ